MEEGGVVYLSTKEAAALIGISTVMLLRSDCPRYRLGNRTVKFFKPELELWVGSRREERIARKLPDPPGRRPRQIVALRRVPIRQRLTLTD